MAIKIPIKEVTIDGGLKKLMWVFRKESYTNSFTKNNFQKYVKATRLKLIFVP